MKDPYSSNKAFQHCDRLAQYQSGGIPVPVQVQFVISDFCNQNCSFCAYRIDNGATEIFHTDDNNNPDRMMATAVAKTILHDLKTAGVKAIQFTGGGEPTMHKDCAEIMLYAHELGMDIALVTNGTNIDDDMLDAITRCTWVRISLDHANAAGYAKMRSTPLGMFDKVVENIAAIVDAKKTMGSAVTVGVGFVVNKDNWNWLHEAALLSQDLGVDNFRISAAFMPDGADHFKKFHAKIYRMAKDLVELSWGDENFLVSNNYGERIGDLKLASPNYIKCAYQYLCTYIGADLNVYRCCVLAYTRRGLIGSLRDTPFIKLWRNNERTQDLKIFDARECARCQFNEKNLTINNALNGSDVAHGNFV